jgi:hypothetical protein
VTVYFQNIFSGERMRSVHNGYEHFIEAGYAIAGDDIAMIQVMGFPGTMGLTGPENPQRNFAGVRTAHANHAYSSGTEGGGNSRYGVLMKHGILPMME